MKGKTLSRIGVCLLTAAVFMAAVPAGYAADPVSPNNPRPTPPTSVIQQSLQGSGSPVAPGVTPAATGTAGKGVATGLSAIQIGGIVAGVVAAGGMAALALGGSGGGGGGGTTAHH